MPARGKPVGLSRIISSSSSGLDRAECAHDPEEATGILGAIFGFFSFGGQFYVFPKLRALRRLSTDPSGIRHRSCLSCWSRQGSCGCVVFYNLGHPTLNLPSISTSNRSIRAGHPPSPFVVIAQTNGAPPVNDQMGHMINHRLACGLCLGVAGISTRNRVFRRVSRHIVETPA